MVRDSGAVHRRLNARHQIGSLAEDVAVKLRLGGRDQLALDAIDVGVEREE